MIGIIGTLTNIFGLLFWLLPAIWGALKGLGKGTGRIGKNVGKIGGAFGQGGVIVAIYSLISKIFAWLTTKLSVFWIGLSVKIAFLVLAVVEFFGKHGILLFLGRMFGKALLLVAKRPILMLIFLVLNDFFPTILETIFRIVGGVFLRIAIPLFLAAFRAMREASESVIGDYTKSVSDVYNGLPDCIGAILSYLNVQGSVGVIVSAFGLCMSYRIIKAAYGFWR